MPISMGLIVRNKGCWHTIIIGATDAASQRYNMTGLWSGYSRPEPQSQGSDNIRLLLVFVMDKGRSMEPVICLFKTERRYFILAVDRHYPLPHQSLECLLILGRPLRSSIALLPRS